MLDVRLYAPRASVVIVWASGELDILAADVLADQVEQQVARAGDVVLDLCNVSVVGPAGVDVLRRLRKEAAQVGVRVHLAAEEESVRSCLAEAALDDDAIHHSAAAAIARLPL